MIPAAQSRHRAPWRWGFTTRLALSTSFLIVVASLTPSWIIVQRDLAEIRRGLIDRGRTIAEHLAHDSELSLLTADTQGLQRLAHGARLQRDVLYCGFLDRSGRSLVSDGELPNSPPLVVMAATEAPTEPLSVTPDVWEFRAPILTTDTRPQREELEFGEEAITAGRVSAHSQQLVGTAVVGVSSVPLQDLRHRVFVTATFVTALVTVLAVISATVLARAITRPLHALAKAADAIARGELNTTVDVQTQDEVGALAASFNTMAYSLARGRAALEEHSRTLEEKVRARTERLEVVNRELEEASRLKTEFLATVSHELRTPLNVIIGYCDMLSSGAGGPVRDEQRSMLDAIQQYSRQQLDLVTNVLDFSRLVSGKVSLHIERFAVRPLLADICAPYQARVAAAGIRLGVTVATDLAEMATDRIKLQEVIRNLVDNAVKYTAAGAISMEAWANTAHGTAIIEVCDTGPGIPADAVAHIFEPFYQVGNGNSHNAGGVGLGLSIVKQLGEVLGGTVGVTSRLGEGTTFRVEVPIHLDPTATDGQAAPAGSPDGDLPDDRAAV